jgi:phosphate-selective porin OprO/OprP
LKFKTKNILIYSAILGCAGSLTIPAYAGTETMLGLLKILRDRGTISQDEFEMLQNAALADEEKEISGQEQLKKQVTEASQDSIKVKTSHKSEREQLKKEVAETSQHAIKVKTGYEGLTLKSADDAFKFQIGGRLQIDANFVDEDQTKLGSGAELRRARLKIKGTMWRIWDYKFQIDFGHGDTSIKDAYIKFKGFKPVSFTLGQQKLPFTLQSWTSNQWIVFKERALINTFIEDDSIGRRRFGFKAHTHQIIHGNHWTAAAGLFGEGIEHKGPFNESWAPMGRITFATITEATRVLHFGVDAYYRHYPHNPNLSFTAYPEIHSIPPLLNSGVISGTEDALLLGGEISAVWGPFHAQSEYLHAHVDRKNGLPNPNFYGWYVQAGYFLTGESRNYIPEEGRYGRIFPQEIVGKGGWGAWEIAARFSTLDLADSGILGGVENDITVALNWYATPSILFRANYVYAHTDPSSIAAGLGVDENVNILGLRAQVVF